MRLCVFVLCVCAVAWRAAASPHQTFLVSCPLSLRLDATETVLVQLFGYASDKTVYVLLKSSMAADGVEYARVAVKLTASNNYQNKALVRIHPKKLVKEATHVIIHVQSEGINQHERIPISRTNGYLFVQTDKPLYTPQQSVKVRAFSLNEELRPANRSVFLKFLDPDYQEVDRVEMTDPNNGIPSLQNPFKLPLEPKIGVWTIQASYSPEFSTLAKTNFEVKEYVLPSMSIQLVPETTYISYDNFEEFTFTIIATYNNGAPVRIADIYGRFGYFSGKNKPTIIPNSVTQYKLQNNGRVVVTANIKHILSRHDGPKHLDSLRDKYLYVTILLKETTGGISQEAELSVKFVKSPYSLSLVATPPFIKPGLPYTIQVVVKDHLGTPLSGVPVQMKEGEQLSCTGSSLQPSNSDGLVKFICNPTGRTSATLKFVTAAESLPSDSQASLSLSVVAYSSLNERYIYIDAPFGHLKVGRRAYINVYTAMPGYIPVPNINYMIMSKGKLVDYGQSMARRSNVPQQTVSFEVTKDMSPSIRLLVYYIVYAEGTAELVADSVWINVLDTCVNGLQTSLHSREQTYRPNGTLQLEISANEGGLVALSAVDTALYSLRLQQKNPLNQVLHHIEQSDQGCGGGGGKNNADVFRLAGLTFITNANARAIPSDEPCTAAVRPKRALTEEEKENKINSFPEKLREFCRKGMQYSPKVLTCEQYAAQLLPRRKYHEVYRRVYTHCCEFLQENLSARDELHSARSKLGPDLDNIPTLVRSVFPESWLWEVHPASSGTVVSISSTLPHSLTTWEFQAVGIFQNGICVADPIRVSVSLPVSLDIPLPYKLVRGEQLELKGSVYNHQAHDRLTYCVTLTVGPGLCVLNSVPSSTSPGQRSTICPAASHWPTLAGESVGEVSFLLMALEAGELTLSFTLDTKERGVLDIVQKTLRVVPEGVRTEVFSGGILDPQGVYGTQKLSVSLKNRLPPDQVPHTKVEREITIHGDALGDIISVRDNPEGLRRLANLPSGSAEDDLAGLFPLVFLWKYLEAGTRWGILGADEKKNQRDLQQRIKDGLVGISSFKSKSTASYSMFPGREPSTWLTAQVVYALAQTDSVEPVNRDYLEHTLTWLRRTAQKTDGSFEEFSTYFPNKIMSKNATELDQSVYLTSFVLIGLHQASQIDDKKLQRKAQEDSMTHAAGYLSQHALEVQSVYVRAVACYAMTLHDPDSQTATQLYDSLEQLAKYKGTPAVLRYWQERYVTADWVNPDASSALTVATTAYVLLTSIAKGRITYANPIMSWLKQDQHYGGAVFSAQDTALTLQAVTEYAKKTQHSAVLDQEIILKFQRKGHGYLRTDVMLTQTRPVASPIQVDIDDNVEAYTGYGTGVSHVKLKTVYYQTTAKNEKCKYDNSIQTFKADASNDSPRMLACVKYKPSPNEIPVASSTVMEIQLPSGIQPFMEDLRPFRDGDEPVVSSYNLKGDILTIQMDSVPSDMFLCVGFRIREEFRVGATSESTFKVYELQDQGSVCTKQYSYSVQKLQRLCEAGQCQCMSVSCATYRGSAGSMSNKDHIQETCQPHIKYAYRVVVNSQTTEGDFIIYTVRVEEVLKTPDEEFEGATKGVDIDLIKKVTCSSVDLRIDSQYLLMGTNGMEFTLSRSFRYRFPLDSGAVVELWPMADCSPLPTATCREHKGLLDDFSLDLSIYGCPQGS